MIRSAAAAASVFACALVLGGCGSGSDRGLSTNAGAQLMPLVQQVRHAAESSNRRGAQDALTALRREVAAYESSGDISSSRAAEILTAAAGVESLFPPASTSTTLSSTTLPAEPAPPTPAKKKDGPGRGDKHEKGG